MKKYVKEVQKFEESSLFNNYYNRFVTFLKMSGHYFKSFELENVLCISGAQVRKLAQHARRSGVLICSGDKGYKYASTLKQADDTLKHLKQRVNSLQFTIDAIEKSNHYNVLMKG